MMKDEGWWFQVVEGFCFKTDRRTNEQTDICDCRVAFATEKMKDGYEYGEEGSEEGGGKGDDECGNA